MSVNPIRRWNACDPSFSGLVIALRLVAPRSMAASVNAWYSLLARPSLRASSLTAMKWM
jgi:hypothetical protein